MGSTWHRIRTQSMLTMGEMRWGWGERIGNPFSEGRSGLEPVYPPKDLLGPSLSRHSLSTADPRVNSNSCWILPQSSSNCWGMWGFSNYLNENWISVGSSGGSVKWAGLMPHWMNLLCETCWGLSWKASLRKDISFLISAMEVIVLTSSDWWWWWWGGIKPNDKHLAWWWGGSRSSRRLLHPSPYFPALLSDCPKLRVWLPESGNMWQEKYRNPLLASYTLAAIHLLGQPGHSLAQFHSALVHIRIARQHFKNYYIEHKFHSSSECVLMNISFKEWAPLWFQFFPLQIESRGVE